MRRIRTFLCIAGMAWVAPGLAPLRAVGAPATQVGKTATNDAPSSVEVRGMEEFNRGQFALALPMLQDTAGRVKDQPDRLSTIQEDIRVCQRNIAASEGAQAVQSIQLASAQPASAGAASAGTASAAPGGAGSASGGPTPAAANGNIPAGMLPGGLGGAPRMPHAKPAPGVVQEMTIKDLGNFDYDAEKGGNIPADVLAMDGSLIRLRGYMIPMDQAEAITQFALVPSLFSCCFGQPPQIQHTIVVHVPKGKAVNYFPDEISVQGKLHVREVKEDGFIVSIFDIDTTSVKPAPK